ncbi:SGNH/GDSL hydrolase family protein [Aeoliella sp. SH292]|uniref:SGNH/GDSL hydrolase family protein n=1 Tax=Aeoliella sp. SH292 TaxID=3454464 RepID=UPI003F9908EE
MALSFAIAATVGAEPAEVSSYLADVRGEFVKKWPENRTVYLVCHGHSVPAGYFETPEVRPFDSYPHLLNVALQERHPTAMIEVVRTAIGGENSEQGVKRFAADVLAKKPDVITIDYALNDRRIGLQRARVAWESMIRQAKEQGVKVILVTPSPDQRSDFNDPKDPLALHAAQVRELAAIHEVGLADSFAAFQQAVAAGTPLADLMSHVNHPNRKGHELIAGEIAPWFGVEPPLEFEAGTNSP